MKTFAQIDLEITLQEMNIPAEVEVDQGKVYLIFTDNYAAECWSEYFPSAEYEWCCYDGYMNAYTPRKLH